MVDANDALTYSPETSRMIWIDCEMTGLDIFHDELCEVSVVPTDFELNVLDKGIDPASSTSGRTACRCRKPSVR